MRLFRRWRKMETLIVLLVVLAILGVMWWAYMQLTLPPPIRMVAAVVIAIAAIAVLLQFVGPGLHLGR